jgi:tRNA 2-selenouridine synthase
MPIQKITIEEFLQLAKQYPVLDVRSPGEYTHAHIPTAHSLPLFTDEERKQVGTAYKQQSREAAIKIGLDYFGVKMKAMVEQAEKIIGNCQLTISNKEKAIKNEEPLPIANCILLHCWRGGMRSAAVAWLLDMYGFKIYLLVGGYKAYRKWVLAQFEKDYNFNIIGGYTGSGKTLILHELGKQNKTIVDLEALANHKGSAFGTIEGGLQPKQEMFENSLAQTLADTGYKILDKSTQNQASGIQYPASVIYLEDESQRIGNVQLPMPLWRNMRKAPVFFMDIPFEERLDYITGEYGKQEKKTLADSIIRIQKRLGGLETKNALNFLEEGNTKECFRILLTYYDKWYHKGLYNRENIAALLNKIPGTVVDTKTNTHKILTCNTVNV